MVLTWAGRTPAPSRLGASCGAACGGWRGGGEGAGGPGMERGPWGFLQHRGVCHQSWTLGTKSLCLNVLCIVTESQLCTACCRYKIEFFHTQCVEDHSSVMRRFGNGFSWALDSNCWKSISGFWRHKSREHS